MVERTVRCLTCNREWLSKAAKPRCSNCGSRNVEDVSVETLPSSPPPPALSGTDYSKVFTAFDEGKTLIDVVKQSLCDPDKALELWNKYEEFKNKTLEIEGRLILEERVDDLDDQISDLRKELQQLSEISSSREKKSNTTRDNLENEISNLKEKSSTTRDNLENKISNLQADLKRLLGTSNDDQIIISGIEQKISAFYNNICPNCGKPTIVLLAKCRNCGMDWDKYL